MSLSGTHVVVTELPEPPPPSEKLAAMVAHGERVALRRPGGELALSLGLFSIWAALVCVALGLRADLSALPLVRYLAGGLAWCAVVAYALYIALAPAKGQVLPSWWAARRVAAFLPLGAATAALLLLVEAPNHTIQLGGAQALSKLVHCWSLGLGVALVPIAWTVLRSRARLLVGAAWIGATIGVAAGALGALVLHLVCPVGGALHLIVGHVGALVAGAVLGAVIGDRLANR